MVALSFQFDGAPTEASNHLNLFGESGLLVVWCKLIVKNAPSLPHPSIRAKCGADEREILPTLQRENAEVSEQGFQRRRNTHSYIAADSSGHTHLSAHHSVPWVRVNLVV